MTATRTTGHLRSLERMVWSVARRDGNKLLDRPKKLTKIGALGMEAVVAVGYPGEGTIRNAYIIARDNEGLEVLMHQLYPGKGSDCHRVGCIAVKFMDGARTRFTMFDEQDILNSAGDEPVDVRLRVQNQAHDAIVDVMRQGGQLEHNPFVGTQAAAELHRLAETHTFDPMIGAIVKQLPS